MLSWPQWNIMCGRYVAAARWLDVIMLSLYYNSIVLHAHIIVAITS